MLPLVPASLAGAPRPLMLAIATIAILPFGACGQDLAERLPEPRKVRDVGPTPKQPFVVFVTGDEEYRSEESMPMLAEILERDFGFKTSVCYAVDDDGQVSPNRLDHIQGLEQLADADLVVWFTRFRQLPESQVQMLLDYVERGGPLVGFRTSTHLFRYPKDHPLAAEFNDEWPARVFGQRWITHHGHFADGEGYLTDVTLGEESDHPILRGVEPFKAYSWLYHVEGGGDSISGTPQKLLTGRTLRSNHAQRHERFPAENTVAWTKEHNEGEEAARVFFTTLGHPYDFRQESMRRLALQGILWSLGLEEEIPNDGVRADPTFRYDPPNSGFGEKYRKNVYPLLTKRGGPGEIALEKGERIGLVGYGLEHGFGDGVELEGVLQSAFPKLRLRFRPLLDTDPAQNPKRRAAWLRDARCSTVLYDMASMEIAAPDRDDPEAITRRIRAIFREHLRTRYAETGGAPQLIVLSPRAIEARTSKLPADEIQSRNRGRDLARRLAERICHEMGIAFVDLFTPMVAHGGQPLTSDGQTLTSLGQTQCAMWFLRLLGENPEVVVSDELLDAIREKNGAMKALKNLRGPRPIFGRAEARIYDLLR